MNGKHVEQYVEVTIEDIQYYYLNNFTWAKKIPNIYHLVVQFYTDISVFKIILIIILYNDVKLIVEQTQTNKK